MYSSVFSAAWLLSSVITQEISPGLQAIIDEFRFPLDSSGKPNRTEPMVDKNGTIHFMSPGKKFVFEFGSNEDQASIDRAIAVMQMAGGFIENALSFNKPVKVAVNHGNYCKNGGACRGNRTDIIGLSAPYFKPSLDINGERQEYPLALFHETYPQNYTEDTCITMFISATSNAIYPEHYAREVVASNADIVSIAIHEMFHGMGFGSLFSKTRNSTLFEDGMYKVNLRHSIFDTHLYTNDTSIKTLLEEATQPTNSSDEHEQHIKNLGNHDSVKKIKDIVNNHRQIYFKTFAGSKVFILNSNETLESNFGHLDPWRYYATKDYLIIHAPILPSDIRKLLAPNNWPTAPIGKLTLEILQTLGYKLNPHPQKERSLTAFYEKMRYYKLRSESEGFIGDLAL